MMIIMVLVSVILLMLESAALCAAVVLLLGAAGIACSVETVIFATMVVVGVLNLAFLRKLIGGGDDDGE